MAGPKLTAGEVATQGIFTFIKSIRNIFLDNPDALIMVLWDGRSWRKDIYSDYKGKREDSAEKQEAREAYYKQKYAMAEALAKLGVIQVYASNMEADDLAEIYSRKFTGDKVTLITGDKDWLQLVNLRTDWFDPILVRGCNWKNFQATTGFENAEKFVEAKCILGDKDEVPGFKGVGPKKVEAIFELYDSFISFVQDKDADLKWAMKFRKNMPKVLADLLVDREKTIEEFNFNRKLADLMTPHRPEPKGLTKTQSSLNMEAFKDFCYRYAFLSFLKDYDKFLKPFKDNKYVRI